MVTIFEQGDIVYLDFDPQSGHEQNGRRPALVISNNLFNRVSSLTMVCPITHSRRSRTTSVHRHIGRYPTRIPPDVSFSYSTTWAASSESSPPPMPSRLACTSTGSAAGCSGRSVWPWDTRPMTMRKSPSILKDKMGDCH